MEMQYGSRANIISSASWWKGLRASEALSPVASIILQIPSAASERNWSLFGNTHTKAHNSLNNTRVENWWPSGQILGF
jgi:hypothetical protein